MKRGTRNAEEGENGMNERNANRRNAKRQNVDEYRVEENNILPPVNAARLPRAPPVPKEIADYAVGGDVGSYAMILNDPSIAKSLTHYGGMDELSIGIRRFARLPNLNAQEEIIKQEIRSSKNAYIRLLILLEDVEELTYVPPKSQLEIRKNIHVFVPRNMSPPALRKEIQDDIISLLNKEKTAGDRCIASLMNCIPYLLASYGEIKYATENNKFQDSLLTIKLNVKNVFLSYRLYFENYTKKMEQNREYTTELGTLQNKITVPAPRMPTRHTITGSDNANSQIVGKIQGTSSWIFDEEYENVPFTNKLKELYSLINFLAIMFPDVAFDCFMVVPENIEKMPVFYEEYLDASLKKANDHFTEGPRVPKERIVGIEGKEDDVEVGDIDEKGVVACTKDTMMKAMSGIVEDPTTTILTRISTKIFEFGCSIFLGPKPSAGAGGPPPSPSPSPSPLPEEKLHELEDALRVDIQQIQDIDNASKQPFDLSGAIAQAKEAAERISAQMMLEGTNQKGGSKSKKTKSRRRRITRNRKKNLRTTRYRRFM
jgi:hypothetical protein